jgi:hypothetical protein
VRVNADWLCDALRVEPEIKKMTEELPPASHLRRYGARYREAWRGAEALRSRRSKKGFPDWPEWCYAPAWYVERHIVAEGPGRLFRLSALLIRLS